MKGAVALLLLILPSIACAEGPTHQQFSFFSSFMQMIAALAIVIGLILLTKHFSGKFISGVAPASLSSKHIRLVETRYIAPKKSLVLIEIGGEYLLLSSTEDRLTLLKQVPVIENIEVVEDGGSLRAGLSGIFRRDARK